MPLTPQRWTHLPKRKGEEGRAAPWSCRGNPSPGRKRSLHRETQTGEKPGEGQGQELEQGRGGGETLNSSYSGALSAACSVPGV